MATSAGDHETILKAIEAWPLDDQITLAYAILRRATPSTTREVTPPQSPRWRQEDNVQIACAQSAGLDFIVTRNTADFAHAPVLPIEPSAVISRLREASN